MWRSPVDAASVARNTRDPVAEDGFPWPQVHRPIAAETSRCRRLLRKITTVRSARWLTVTSPSHKPWRWSPHYQARLRLRLPAYRRRREDTGRNQESGSVVEYVCHLRDVYMTYTIRLHRTRTENRPTLEPMFNDLRARRFRYNERDVEAVIDELASATAGFCDEVACNSGDDWDRTASRLPGEQRTALWLVRQAMHEGVHHLGDIRRISDSGPA
jgi:hypothetical protein